MNYFSGFPRQRLSYKEKNKEWRKKHLDWADKFTFASDSSVRKDYKRKSINYNLINGIIDMEDIELVLNPNQIDAGYIPDKIQYFPIINSKLNVIRGEESKRRFNARATVTNPDAISAIENNRKEAFMSELEEWLMRGVRSEEEAQRELERLTSYYKYEWQDIRERRANFVLTHYYKELNMPKEFNEGIMDAMIAGEEAYQCDIVGGEPTMVKLDTRKMTVLQSSHSRNFEDADVIILWDYWSRGRIVDSFYDVLTEEQRKSIDEINTVSTTQMGEYDSPEVAFIDPVYANEPFGVPYGEGSMIQNMFQSYQNAYPSSYTDFDGNIRVVRIYWKSQRDVKYVKSYDPETGEAEYNFYPGNYIPNTDLGEEAVTMWINEAWEATKVGKDNYINMRPRVVQYNRLSNPSKCHFGIVGSVYSLSGMKPYTLVDIAKPYAYYYSVIHDRLNKNIAANWGRILKLDLALVPKGWDIAKWIHFAKINHVAITDSFKEGNVGQAKGKLAGLMNNQSSGVIDADTGNSIQNDIELLQFIKMEMSESIGISPQREGQVSNRETVGGVERSVLQSSHITEWLFAIHEDVKRRVLTCFLETSKAAMKGRSMKFPYILDDGTRTVMEIQGDEFADCDYGVIVDNSDELQDNINRLTELAQSLIQNQMISVSSLMSIWSNSNSLSTIRRTIEADERAMQERQNQEREAQAQQFQADLEARAFDESEKRRIQEESNIRDNETRILIEQMKLDQSDSEDVDEEYDPVKHEELRTKIRDMQERLELEKSKFNEQKAQNRTDNRFKQQELNIKRTQSLRTNNNTNE